MVNKENYLSNWYTAIQTKPSVMGIINCTPDSFYLDSRATYQQEVIELAAKHLRDGADCIDLGAVSSRPHNELVDEAEELRRIKDPLDWIVSAFPEATISVDTFRARVAEYCLSHGAHVINDISAGQFDPLILDVVKTANCPYVAMHLQGDMSTMHQAYSYPDITKDVYEYFAKRLRFFNELGLDKVIIDPGFGFSKSGQDNFDLLSRLDQLKTFGHPVLVGVSRKRMVWQTTGGSPEEALNGTTVLNTIALRKGATVLRVHDVKEAVEAIKLTSKLVDSPALSA